MSPPAVITAIATTHSPRFNERFSTTLTSDFKATPRLVLSLGLATAFVTPVKAVTATSASGSVPGEFVISARGVEGGGIYAISRDLREGAALAIDVMPDVTEVEVAPGTRVLACAYLGTVEEPALAAHANTHLARYKQPRLWVRLDHLPRNANLKLNRRALRAMGMP